MKVLLLAGGRGSRINEETELRPKPMVEIGGKPIIWHIMKMYAHWGYNEFIFSFYNYYFQHTSSHLSESLPPFPWWYNFYIILNL